jgi:nucleotide-binding universal stress UspA family protein
MTHVLVAVDDSTRARNALEFVLDEHADAEITVLHVISPIAVAAVSEPSVWDDQLAERTREEAEELLAGLRSEATARDVDVRTEIVHGHVPEAIVEYAGENDVDHIVLGSHGRTGFSRVLLGSVAETVVRRAPIPVTVVR